MNPFRQDAQECPKPPLTGRSSEDLPPTHTKTPPDSPVENRPVELTFDPVTPSQEDPS